MKIYNIMNNVGSAKYLVNFHDGKQLHKDGSIFFDIRIFKNKPSLYNFITSLKNKGYTQRRHMQ